jgi:hypothetical protein
VPRWDVVAAKHSTAQRSYRMDVHQNAKTTPNGRLLMVQRLAEGWQVARVTVAWGVTAKTVCKWQARHAEEGRARLRHRSSRPAWASGLIARPSPARPRVLPPCAPSCMATIDTDAIRPCAETASRPPDRGQPT